MQRLPGTESRLRSLCVHGAWIACSVAASLAGCARFGNASLTFTPSVFPECKGPNIVVDVAWDATARTKKPVQLLAYQPGSPPNKWQQAPPKGHRNTGMWMADGTTIVLEDSSGRLLAMRTLETVPCPKDSDRSAAR